MTETDAWSDRLTRTTAQAVLKWRTRRGLNQQELAARCADLGHPITRSSLANLESKRGRPSISVAEVFVLAAALNVPPTALLLPEMHAGEFEVLPGLTTDPLTAWMWITGSGSTGSLIAFKIDKDTAVGYVEASNEVFLTNTHKNLAFEVDQAWTAARNKIEAEQPQGPADYPLRIAANTLSQLIGELRATRNSMQLLSMPLPPLTDAAAEAVRYDEMDRPAPGVTRGGRP